MNTLPLGAEDEAAPPAFSFEQGEFSHDFEAPQEPFIQ